MPDGRLRREWAWTIDGSQTSSAPVSPADCVRIRATVDGTALEVSYDGAAYVTLGGSGSAAWSALTAPTADLTLNHGNYTTTFNFDGADAEDCFLIQSANNAAGSGVVLYVKTNGASTTKSPFRVDAKGSVAMAVDVNGYLGIGTASPDASARVHVAASSSFKTIITHDDDSIYLKRAAASASSASIVFHRSRGSFASPAALSSGDVIGNIGFIASVETGAGSDVSQLGSFSMIAARDLSEADYAAGFRWQTKDSADSISLRNRMWLTSLGYLGIGQNLAVTDVTHRLTVSGDVKFDLGSDATGDMWYRAATTGTFTRFGTSGASAGYVLTLAGSPLLPTWAASTLKWNSISNPDGNQALTMAAYTSTWTWNATTSTNDLFVITNTTDDIGTGALVAIATPGTSNAKTPFRVTTATNSRFEIGATGLLNTYGVSTGSAPPSTNFWGFRGTLASKAAVQSGDAIGTIGFYGYADSSATAAGASISGIATTTWDTAPTVKAALKFATRDSTQSLSVRNRMWITSLGYVGIGNNLAVTDVTARLHVKADIADVVGFLLEAPSSGTANILTVLNQSAATTLSVSSAGKLVCYPTSGISGLNVGSYAGNPSSLADGDIWYNSTGNVLNARINGSTVSLGAGGGANTALSNLASVSINASLIPQTGLDLGAAATAWRALYLYGAGTYGSHSIKLTGTPTANQVLTLPDVSDTVAVLGIVQTFTAAQTVNTSTTATGSAYDAFTVTTALSPAGSATGIMVGIRNTIQTATTQTQAAIYGIYSTAQHSRTSTVTALTGAYLEGAHRGTSGTITTLYGVNALASTDNGGTVTSGAALNATVSCLSGTVTTGYGLKVLTNRTSGTFTTAYGVYIDSSGTITNKYALVTTSGAGNVGIGTTAPTVSLDVVGRFLLSDTRTDTAASTISLHKTSMTFSPASPAGSTGWEMLNQTGTFGTAQNVASLVGIRQDFTHGQNATLNAFYGISQSFNHSAGTVGSAYGLYSVLGFSAGTITSASGATFSIECSGSTITDAVGFYAVSSQTSGTFTSYTAFKAVYTGTIGTKYGFISSNGFLHGFGTLTPTYTMDVAGTARIVSNSITALEVNSSGQLGYGGIQTGQDVTMLVNSGRLDVSFAGAAGALAYATALRFQKAKTSLSSPEDIADGIAFLHNMQWDAFKDGAYRTVANLRAVTGEYWASSNYHSQFAWDAVPAGSTTAVTTMLIEGAKVGISDGTYSAGNALSTYFQVAATPSATNTITELARWTMNSSGTPAAGLGVRHNYTLEPASGSTPQTASYMDVRWQDATTSTRSAVHSIQTVANAAINERQVLGGYKALTDNTQTDLFSIAFGTGDHNAVGGFVEFVFIARQTSGSNQIQSYTKVVPFNAYHNASTNTGAATWGSEALTAGITSTGGITFTWRINGSATMPQTGFNTATFQIVADSDLSTVLDLVCYYNIYYSGQINVTLA